MLKFSKFVVASVVLAGISQFSITLGFAPKPTVTNYNVGAKISSCVLSASRAHPEFEVLEEGEEDDFLAEKDFIEAKGDNTFIINSPEYDESLETSTKPSNKPKPEYGALSPGTVVQIQVGDISLARKAWKKRRRTGSPLLVPCSVLNVDRQSMVRWNLIHLLEKFGATQTDGLEISVSELSKRYRTFLKSSLKRQAEDLNYESTHDLIVALFNKKAQESYGIRLIEDEEGNLFLKAPISRHNAQKRAAGTPILQFRKHRKGDHGDSETMTHTGHIRTRTDKENSERTYGFLALSAALRVSQKDDLDSGRVEEGSFHPAVVYDYDPIGDSGSPLLTLSLNPRGVREGLKIKPDKKYTPIENPQHLFEELSVGDGPFRARVVQLLPGKALVDLEVGRKVSSQGMIKVLGGLRFQDSVELLEEPVDTVFSFEDDRIDDIIDGSLEDFDDDDDDDDDPTLVEDLSSLSADSSLEDDTFEEGEEEEDITNLFMTNEDGSVTFNDPETGESFSIDDDDEDYEDMKMVEDLIRSHTTKAEPAKVSKKPQEAKTEKSIASKTTPKNPRFKSKRLRVDDFVDVYIRSVSKQSSQFTVTTNPLIQGRSAKEIKKESGSQKKLKRLKESLGGSLKRIWELEGQKCVGVVKATSNSGNWIYVQPELGDLPVGIATLEKGSEVLVVGDSVQVQIAGVDEQRGQLSMKYIGKLRP